MLLHGLSLQEVQLHDVCSDPMRSATLQIVALLAICLDSMGRQGADCAGQGRQHWSAWHAPRLGLGVLDQSCAVSGRRRA